MSAAAFTSRAILATSATPTPSAPRSSLSPSRLPSAVHTAVTAVVSTTRSAPGASSSPTGIQIGTLIAAVLAVVVALVSITLVRVTGSGTVKAAKDSAKAAQDAADASGVSSKAADRAATAAEESGRAATKTADAATADVEFNRDMARSATRAADAATEAASATKESEAAATKSADQAEAAVAVGARSAGAAERAADAAQASADSSERFAEMSAAREDQALRFKRYQNASALLGHEKETVRVAGAVALARLADDSEVQRQECVDLLCAYLRMPWVSLDRFDETEPPGPAETQVRRAIVDAIARHVAEGATVSWSGLSFDFTGAKLPKVQFMDAVFEKRVSFDRAEFLSKAMFRSSVFAEGASFQEVVFIEGVDFHRSQFGRLLDLSDAIFPLHTTTSFIIEQLDAGDSILLRRAHVTGKLTMALGASPDPQGRMILGTLWAPGDHDPLRIIKNTLAVNPGGGELHYPTILRGTREDKHLRQIEIDPDLVVEFQDE